MFNKLIIIGNITKSLELVNLPNGEVVAKSSIATNDEYTLSNGVTKKDDCFVDFNIYGKLAQYASRSLKKGSKVLFEGSLVYEKWTNKQNQPRNKHSFRVETIKFLGYKKDEK
ncbi:MAG: single-stranded DNA-binding protein [Arcobacter sp.]|nr:single-stranded DNA-binding protein [Arcobacter sp.]|tara:strand:- start:43992 stop:44330 length:339 start_codon:yes stop_codon:yes gene_type:complete